ncbi:hypothetical protein [Desulfoscipio geothermicus]|uniref:Uncharacterized protein n=1 Tax=Desulfoscipio geothermicus DSM 3669 TaxID=1121426 RepID=A0A1I6D4Q6_9FIRM|nr:hypothetical protein [Desulfoscipio geothermicus]SFR00479.1 hypothetical protein SAMN05660706_105115 [Desulfoscipio geothermicus DSM 3669]
MSVITAHEWYREYHKAQESRRERDYEMDAPEAGAVDEKIYG